MHFGARQIERIGDQRHGLGRHTTQRTLNVMEDLEQRPGLVLVTAHGIGHCRRDVHVQAETRSGRMRCGCV